MLSLLLAKKLFSPFSTKRTWNTLIALVLGTLSISIAALLIAGALLEAFHQETLATFQNIQSDLSVNLPSHIKIDFELQKKLIQDSLGESFVALDNVYETPVVLANPAKEQCSSARLTTKNFQSDPLPYQLPPKSSWSLQEIPPKTIFLGHGLAQELQVEENDELLVLTAQTYGMINEPDYDPEAQILTVNKIIKTDIDEIDDTLLLTNEETFQKVTGQAKPNYLHIRLSPKTNLEETAKQLQQKILLPVHSWLDYYPTLQSALSLEKTIFFIITLFILTIVLCSLPSLLVLLLEQKRTSISILILTGIPANSIKIALAIFAAVLISSAQLIALAFALTVCFITQKWPILNLPSNYYHSSLALHLSPTTTLLILSASTILGGLIIWFTTQSISHKAIKHFVKKGF